MEAVLVRPNIVFCDCTRQDALQFRDWLVARGLTGSSITRNFSYLKAVINFVLSEYALDVRNPFIGVYLDRSAGVLVRKPVPITDTRNAQSECRAIDDDMRCLIALISNTGRRLVQGAGLLKRTLWGLILICLLSGLPSILGVI